MKVVEKFTSINGEGTRAGELAVFIRFKAVIVILYGPMNLIANIKMKLRKRF